MEKVGEKAQNHFRSKNLKFVDEDQLILNQDLTSKKVSNGARIFYYAEVKRMRKIICQEIPILLDELTMSREECERVISELKKDEHPLNEIKRVKISLSADGRLDVEYDVEQPKFERIRRITGYLTGTLDRWNDSKKAEELERVKHGE